MVPHALVLAIGFIMIGVIQGGVHTEPQLLIQTNSEKTQHTEIVAITKVISAASEPIHDMQTSSTIVPTETPTLWLPNPLSEYQNLVDFCTRIQADSDQWRYALNQVTFSSDVSDEAQKRLPDRVHIRPSCNFDFKNQPRAIVLHYTEGSLEATIATFQEPHNSSAHYVIDREGKVYQVIPEQFSAYHVNCYGNQNLCISSCPVCTDADGSFVEPRSQTIGIELVNLGHVDPRYYNNQTMSANGSLFEDYNNSFGYRFWEEYPQVQIQSLQILVEDICSRWNIPVNMVIGHSRINNNVDPGPALNLFWMRYGNPKREAIFKYR